MGLYTYQHPKTKKTIDIVQSMNDTHEFYDANGVRWNRVFTKPNATIDAQINPFSARDFAKKTEKYTVGECWDLSAEMSEKRKKIEGKDKVKEKTISDYRKKCKGKRHPHE